MFVRLCSLTPCQKKGLSRSIGISRDSRYFIRRSSDTVTKNITCEIVSISNGKNSITYNIETVVIVLFIAMVSLKVLVSRAKEEIGQCGIL